MPMKVRVLLAASALLALSAGCTSDTENEEPRPPDRVRSPFTGLAAEPAPVLVVKVDNVPAARPQTGLEDADIIYTEQVETGLSRLMAVYSGSLPEEVGPVRSAREPDLELLRQFGLPVFAFSGAQSKLLPLIQDAPLLAVTPDVSADAYQRSQELLAPHNLFLGPKQAVLAAPEADDASDIGFRFDEEVPPDGRPVTETSVTYPNASFTFTWSKGQSRWLVSTDGAPMLTAGGEQLEAATVVVQHVHIRPSDFHDSSGNVTPYSETTGSGTARVLRDGEEFEARWSRGGKADGTEFTSPDGERLPFAVGPVWVVLADADE